ncbi:MAG TPA: PDZ domain-containing protein [Gammaproteobacteria bacterium]
MNHKFLTVIGLVSMGVMAAATFNALTGSQPASPEVKRPAKTSPESGLGNPFAAPAGEAFDATFDSKLAELEHAIQTLQETLQSETQKRRQLEQKVALLDKGAQPDNNAQASGIADPASMRDAANSRQTGGGNLNPNWFNEQALLDAGIDHAKVSYIKNVFEQSELDRLYIRDQATREGWMGTERFNNAVKEIADRSNALREQLSDNEYDAYLYAAGLSNRVIVESVLSNSPAGIAGIKSGDIILSYDNQRIYNWPDLTSATSQGTVNATVAVNIIRDNQQQLIYVPRGPLGIRLTTDSVAP